LSLPRRREDQKSLEVVRQILHPNLRLGPQEANPSNQFATHGGDLMAKDLFDAGANA